MELSSRSNPRREDGLQVLSEDGERVFCREWRCSGAGSNLTVRLAGEHPSASSIVRLAHECELKDEVDEAWALRPLDLRQEGWARAAKARAPCELPCVDARSVQDD